MPLFTYRCRTCETQLDDVLVMPHEEEPTGCSCGGTLAKCVTSFLPRIAEASPTAGRDGPKMWGPEHVAQLRTGDVAATREVHYDVMRNSGMSADAANHHADRSAAEGVATTAKHLSSTTPEQRDPSSVKAQTVVADG